MGWVTNQNKLMVCGSSMGSSMGLCPLQGSIEGRRDLAGGRLSSDRRALGNSTSGQCFTSLAFSAYGAFLLAGGSTKYVCMYDVEEKVMLRRFQVGLHTHRLGAECLLLERHQGPLFIFPFCFLSRPLSFPGLENRTRP